MDSHDHLVPDSHRGRLTAAFTITAVVLLAQVVGALLTGSLALLVDTVHLLTDAAGLAMALFAAHLVERPPSARRTWGYRRAEVIAALAQSGVLLAVGGYVLVEGVTRLASPPDVPGRELVVFGVIGLVGNLAAMAVLAGRRSANLNLRAAFLEVVNDALGSLAVVVAAVVITLTGWHPTSRWSTPRSRSSRTRIPRTNAPSTPDGAGYRAGYRAGGFRIAASIRASTARDRSSSDR